jgi:hypothetical protein
MSTAGREAIRAATEADGPDIAGIHAEVGAYYSALAPDRFQVPEPPELPPAGEDELHLVADLGRRRLRIE